MTPAGEMQLGTRMTMRRIPRVTVWSVALLFGQGLLSKPDVSQPPSGAWGPTGHMAEIRSGASAALLSDGHVLVTGGAGADGPLATAELYDSGGFFVATTPMHVARSRHASVVVQDGRVLVAGGASISGQVIKAAEIYDPATTEWSIVGDMAQARSGHTATRLKDGRVLVAGGQTAAGATAALELFDPATNAFTRAGALSSPRGGHAAALLPDGRVLISGGSSVLAALAR